MEGLARSKRKIVDRFFRQGNLKVTIFRYYSICINGMTKGDVSSSFKNIVHFFHQVEQLGLPGSYLFVVNALAWHQNLLNRDISHTILRLESPNNGDSRLPLRKRRDKQQYKYKMIHKKKTHRKDHPQLRAFRLVQHAYNDRSRKRLTPKCPSINIELV